MSSKPFAWSAVAWSMFVLIGCDPPQNITPPPGSTGPAKTESGGAEVAGSGVPVAPAMPAKIEDTAARPVPDGFTQTDSGLRYKIITEGTGRKPTPADRATAKYRGWFDDGKQFDAGDITFSLVPGKPDSVISGWTEAVQLIGEGGKIELEIPPQLAYGAAGHPGGIPPNAWLHFEMELLKVQ